MNQEKYHISIRILHWLMAIIIIALLAVGFYMTNGLSKEAPYRMTIYNLHKSLGVTILTLIALRIFFRLSRPIPLLPDSMPKVIQKLAHSTHFLLYLLMILMPLSGYLMSNSYGFPVYLFGLKMPILVERNMDMAQFFAEAHGYLGFILVGVLVLHIAGVIKHRFFDKNENDILSRMI